MATVNLSSQTSIDDHIGAFGYRISRCLRPRP
jgi:hypothetical protein